MSAVIKGFLAGGLAMLGAACASPPAEAGQWHLVAPRCPDLVEDRHDRRIVWSRADLREDARDTRRVVCPASAYVYVPGPREHAVRRAWRHDAVVYLAPGGRYAVRDRNGRDLDVRLVFHID